MKPSPNTTLAEALAFHGYRYEPSKIEGKQNVFTLADGKTVGCMDAEEGWEFIRSLDEKFYDQCMTRATAERA